METPEHVISLLLPRFTGDTRLTGGLCGTLNRPVDWESLSVESTELCANLIPPLLVALTIHSWLACSTRSTGSTLAVSSSRRRHLLASTGRLRLGSPSRAPIASSVPSARSCNGRQGSKVVLSGQSGLQRGYPVIGRTDVGALVPDRHHLVQPFARATPQR